MDWMKNSEDSFEEFRSKGLGSSDMPIIMGVSPWKKPHGLWLEKTGIKESTFTGNWATRRGNELEPMVRDWYNKKFGTKMEVVRKIHGEFPYLRGNADGVDFGLNKMIEIKCGNLEDHARAYDHGVIPKKYYPQVMFLSFLFDMPIDYVSYNEKFKEPFVVVKMEADPHFTEIMLEKAHHFWSMVQSKTPPLLDSTEDMVIEDDIIAAMVKKYSTLKTKKDEMENELKELSVEISSMTTHKKTVCNGWRLAWVERKGNVNYKKVPELEGVNLEDYRNKPSTFFTMKELKK